MSTYSIELKKYELGKSLDPIFKLIQKRLLVLSDKMSEQLGSVNYNSLRNKIETFDEEKNGKKVTTGYSIKIFNFPEEFDKENKLNTMKSIKDTSKHNFRAMLLEKEKNTFEVKRMKIVRIKFENDVPDKNKKIIIDYLSSYALYKEWIQKHQLKIIKDKDGMYLRGTIKRVNEVVTLLKDVIKRLNNSPEHSYTFKERKFKKRKRKKYTLELKDKEFGYEEKYNMQVYKITYQKSVPLKL